MLFNKRQIVGLDIGTTHVKAVQLRKELRGYTMTAVNICPIAPWGSDKQKYQQHTIQTIRECLEPMDIHTRYTVCGVSGPEVAVRPFALPQMKPEELKGAITFEAAQVCPFDISPNAIDFHIIHNNNTKTYGFFVAAHEGMVQQKQHMISAANLRCVLMDVDGLALLNAFRELGYKKQDQRKNKDNHNPQTMAILNIGSNHTTLAIQSEATAPLIRDITFAGNYILSEMGVTLPVCGDDVAGFLKERSQENPSDLHASLEQGCQYLIDDVTKTLKYYENQNNVNPIQHIWICGGLALIPGLVNHFNAKLPLEANLWNPYDHIRCNIDKEQEEKASKTGPMLAVAMGLAMRSI